jgi:hypothetical protein
MPLPDIVARASYLATLFWLPADAKALPNVKLIQFFSAGTNHIAQHPIYTDSKIPLCSANGVHGPQIAEWVIMMDLVHSHKFPKLYDLQKEKTWKQAVGMGISDRVGKRVGILGYGSIGRQGKFHQLFYFLHAVGRSTIWSSPGTRALNIPAQRYLEACILNKHFRIPFLLPNACHAGSNNHAAIRDSARTSLRVPAAFHRHTPPNPSPTPPWRPNRLHNPTTGQTYPLRHTTASPEDLYPPSYFSIAA